MDDLFKCKVTPSARGPVIRKFHIQRFKVICLFKFWIKFKSYIFVMNLSSNVPKYRQRWPKETPLPLPAAVEEASLSDGSPSWSNQRSELRAAAHLSHVADVLDDMSVVLLSF